MARGCGHVERNNSKTASAECKYLVSGRPFVGPNKDIQNPRQSGTHTFRNPDNQTLKQSMMEVTLKQPHMQTRRDADNEKRDTRNSECQACRHSDTETLRHSDTQTFTHSDNQTFRHSDTQTFKP